MKKILPLTLCLIFAFCFPVLAAQVNPSPQATNPVLPISPLAPLANQLDQTIQTLVGTSAPQPAIAGTAGQSALEDTAGQITDSFATTGLDALAKLIDTVKDIHVNLTPYISAWPDFNNWLSQQSSDPRHKAFWAALSDDLPIIIGIPLLIACAALLLLIPLRFKLKRNRPQTLAGRMGLLVVLFITRIVPVILFTGASLLLLDQNETQRLPRFVILNIIYALSLGYMIQQILRGFLAPSTPHLRPLKLSTPHATSAYRWISAFNFLIVYSYFLIDVATALRAPDSVATLFQNIFALVLTVMALGVIFQTRIRVALILRGPRTEDEEEESFSRTTRLWLARHWHRLATIYLIVSLIITLLGIGNGFTLMLRGTLLSILILYAMRVAFVVIDLWRMPKAGNSSLVHRQLLSFLLRPVIWLLAAGGLAAIWGAPVTRYFTTTPGQRFSSALISIALTLLILTALYETLNASIDRHLSRRDKASKLPLASARARTLLPMLRNSIFILFSVVAALTGLSAIGVNIGPLLAGAGVIGVAIGFGSQTLVKDFLTGLFIVLENTIAVGDMAKIDSLFGTVETISIRTIRLRDYDGSLHILPFSEVTKITNMSRGFAYALVDVNVAYNSDLERAMDVLREVGAALQEDAVFKRVILEPIEVMGVENLGDSSITIRARIRTRPGKQLDVRRLLLLRIKQRFDKENIEIPFPTVKHITTVTRN